MIQEHAGLIGTTVTGGSASVGWFVANTPQLQGISFLVAIAAGVLTIVWYLVKLGEWVRGLFKG